MTGEEFEKIKADADRLAFIRDCFLEGKDREAVAEILRLKPLEYGDDVYDVVPISSTGVVAASQTIQMSVRPQTNPFQPIVFGLPPLVADRFVICNIMVGNRSQFVTSGDIDGELFRSNYPFGMTIEPTLNEYGMWTCDENFKRHLGIPLRFETCQIAQDLVVHATNRASVATMFRGWFLGTMIKEKPYTFGHRYGLR